MNNTQPSDLDRLRHSAAHLLAAAVLEIWPDAKLAIGPATDQGFYYDIEFPSPVSDKDLTRIEKRMKKILPSWTEFTHKELSKEEARELFRDNPYKLELIDEIAEKGELLTVYQSGSFTDLCRGGHVEHPNKELVAFCLLSLAGSYWCGDENNPMLTRIYGTAFPTQEELDAHLHTLEEAKKRDHRKLGKQLDLFTFSPLVGPGLPLFTPRGTIVRNELERLVQSIQEPLGYQRVTIPHITKPDLYKTSGHWKKFGDELFKVKGKTESDFVMKPMNCPHHTQIYAAQQRSYRDLPMRFSEVTMVYRDEQAGELQGLSRVRSITQDDAHVFCTPDQIGQEISLLLDAYDRFHQVFGFDISIRLSLRDPSAPENYLGDDTVWEQAERALRQSLQDKEKHFVEEKGEAAFYGPKIDFMTRDSLQRQWQISTIQLDFNMPERFELTYTDGDGNTQRPVMIHRAILGSLERFMAVILEHYAGNLPLWLAPDQVAILPIADDQHAYASDILSQLAKRGIRAFVDDRSESIGKKIRDAQTRKIPRMFIIGKQEVEASTVSVRSREDGDLGAIPAQDAITAIQTESENRT